MRKQYFGGAIRYYSLKYDERKFFDDCFNELETWKLCNDNAEEIKERHKNSCSRLFIANTSKLDKVLSEFERKVLYHIAMSFSSDISGVLIKDAVEYLESGFLLENPEGEVVFEVLPEQIEECVKKFIRLDIMREIHYKGDQCPYFVINPWLISEGTPSDKALNEFKWSRWKMMEMYDELIK